MAEAVQAPVEAAPAPEQHVTSSAVSDFARELADSVKAAPQQPEAKPDKPAPQPKEGEVESPSEVKLETPKTEVEKAKPAAKEKPLTELSSEELDAVMKKAPSKAWKIYEFFKDKTNAELTELRNKLKSVEAKPESPANDKKIEQYENQIKELNESLKTRDRTISELDYSRSPEFQKKYVTRYNNAKKTAEAEIAQLTVTDGDNQRAATAQDFDLLLALPLRDQISRAKAMFGDAADVFFQHRNLLQNIRREGMEALQTANEEAEQRRTQSDLQSKEEQRVYDTTLDNEQKALASEFPELFGDTDNQEASTAFQKGLEFSKRILAERSNMTPAERASHDAVLQMTHAGYRRAVVEIKAQSAQIEALEAELAKYRDSDPGKQTTGKAAAPAGGDDDVGGIDSTASFIAGKR